VRQAPSVVADGELELSVVPLSPCITQESCMARGRKTSLTIHLTPAERRTLRAWQRASTISAGLARRGRVILLVADGVPITAIAARVGISRRFVYKWVQRFLEQRIEGLVDRPGRGRRPRPAPPQEQYGLDAG
jgi:hypothetical protein